MHKSIPYILILLMAIAVIVIRKYQQSNKSETMPEISTPKSNDPAGSTNRDRGFDRRVSFLKYSKHAKCRMECRKISEAEVEEIMDKGNINYHKSDIRNARCPRYALEGVTRDKQRVRIVYAQCNESTTVVTVIDLETEFDCRCPGDPVAMRYGIRDTGYEIRDTGYEIRDTRYGMRDIPTDCRVLPASRIPYLVSQHKDYS